MNQATTKKTIRIHYARRDGDDQGWGLHLWGPALELAESFWNPKPFVERDDFGLVVSVEVDHPERKLSFLVHRHGHKDVSSDRAFPDLEQRSEYWIKQGRMEVWTQRPRSLVDLIRAEAVSATQVSVLADGALEGLRPKDCAAVLPEVVPSPILSLVSDLGHVVPVAEERLDGRSAVLTVARPLDFSRNYFVESQGGVCRVPVFLSGGLLDAEFHYTGRDLGAVLEQGRVAFKLWSPPATRVVLHLFDRSDSSRPLGQKPLVRGEKGVWEAQLAPGELGVADWDGCFYQYEVTAYGKTTRALDPYARSMAAFDRHTDPIGKAAIVDPKKADPEGFAADDFSNLGRRGPGRTFARMHNPADVVAYEVHVRDFTISSDSGVDEPLRGTYRGFVQPRPLAHLAALGVTHVQLMPVQAIHTVREADRTASLGNDPERPNYNWGYDPQNYFTPSGWFATDPHDPYCRVRELKELVKALHEQRIGVILDIVYNHVYDVLTFESVAPGCYFRLEGEGLVSNRTGAGPSLETRRWQVRKLIVDSLRYLVEEFHVDGFRFDLMGFIDRDTMCAVRTELGDDVLLYGEAWDLTDLPGHEAVTKSNLPDWARVGAFSDTTRDAYTGRLHARGFAQGLNREAPRVRAGVVGNVVAYGSHLPLPEGRDERFARSPCETVNMLAVHDGFTLWDKLNLSVHGGSEDVARHARLALAMLFTSQGRVLLQGGDEMGRTKPRAMHDPSPDRAHTSPDVFEEEDVKGVRYFHENSYISPDYTNMFRWARLSREPFRSLADYTAGLVRMRRAFPAFRYESAEHVQAGVRFIGQPVQLPAARPETLGGFHSLAELPSLTVVFLNGPAWKTCYVTGEVFPKGHEKNPRDNPFRLRFDSFGEASIRFSREQIARFDLGAWGDPHSLRIKLVEEPGSWNTVGCAYSSTGSNTIPPEAVGKDLTLHVDLAAEDHLAGSHGTRWSYLAYELDNTLGARKPITFDRLVVVHNADREPVTVESESIENPAEWGVILNGRQVNLEGATHGGVVIGERRVTVPRKSSAVIGHRTRA